MLKYHFASIGTWPREKTPPEKRKHSAFRSTYKKSLDVLETELRHLQASGYLIFEIGVKEHEVRIDGDLRSDARNPQFPGLILHLEKTKYGPLKFLCDDCTTWQHNLHAIALTMQRLRHADLYGAAKRGEQYQGWKSLPAPQPPMMAEDAAEFLRAIGGGLTTDILSFRHRFDDAFRNAVKRLHPDRNGGQVQRDWSRLQQAKDVLEQHFAGIK